MVLCYFRLHVCLRRAKTGGFVCRTTNITRLTAVAKKVLSENIARQVIVAYDIFIQAVENRNI